MRRAEDEPRRVLVAVAVTDDESAVAKGMFGTAPKFLVCEVRGTSARVVRRVENIYAHTQQHGKTLDVWELVDECSVLIASRVGPRGQERLRNKGVELYLTRKPVSLADVFSARFDATLTAD